MLIDTHAHILKEYYEDGIDEVIKNAKEAGIGLIINNGCDGNSNKEVIEMLNKKEIYGAIGIHPEAVLNYTEEDIAYIEKNIAHEKVVAIGEIGLDYYYSKEDREEQIKLFERQLKIAEDNNIPVIVHSREATEDTIKSLQKFHIKGIIHSFSGSYETAQIYIKMGFKLGINGVITFKNCNLKEVYKKLSLNDFVLETDSPYLTPHPYRGTKNEPKHIAEIANFIANLYGISLDELAEVTNRNIASIFDKIRLT
ncbi:MAG: TatD family hydrolase [Bacilli bacterium]|nr:TatD family hydrolase [Bacilli bacterium]